MGEYLIASLQHMSTVSMKYEKEKLMIFAAGIMVVAIDWTDSKAVAITALEIHVFRQIVHGGSCKTIATKKRLVAIQMCVSFV